jgi:hypothetical protein
LTPGNAPRGRTGRARRSAHWSLTRRRRRGFGTLRSQAFVMR